MFSKFFISKNNFIIKRNSNYYSSDYLTKNKSKTISLISKNKLSTGWYLWGFKQISNNKRCYSFLNIGIYGFKQGRIMSPGKIRWRVVHFKRKDFCNIEIHGIENPLKTYNFFFIRTLLRVNNDFVNLNIDFSFLFRKLIFFMISSFSLSFSF